MELPLVCRLPLEEQSIFAHTTQETLVDGVVTNQTTGYIDVCGWSDDKVIKTRTPPKHYICNGGVCGGPKRSDETKEKADDRAADGTHAAPDPIGIGIVEEILGSIACNSSYDEDVKEDTQKLLHEIDWIHFLEFRVESLEFRVGD